MEKCDESAHIKVEGAELPAHLEEAERASQKQERLQPSHFSSHSIVSICFVEERRSAHQLSLFSTKLRVSRSSQTRQASREMSQTVGCVLAFEGAAALSGCSEMASESVKLKRMMNRGFEG